MTDKEKRDLITRMIRQTEIPKKEKTRKRGEKNGTGSRYKNRIP